MLDIAFRFVANFFSRAMAVLRRYPVVVGLGVVMACLWSQMLDASSLGTFEELTIAVSLAAVLVGLAVVALSFLYSMKAIKKGARAGLTAGALVIAMIYAYWIYPIDQLTELWRWQTLSVALVAAVAVVPLGARGFEAPREVRFWRFNSRLVVRLVVCTLYLGMLYVGLCLGLAAFDYLFDGIVKNSLYGHLLVWLVFGAGPWMFIAGVDDITDLDRPIPDSAIVWIARIGSYLLVPLLAIYLVMTYAYGLRVVFTDFSPSNIISPLVLGAGIMGFLGMYLVEPLRHRGDYELLSKLFQFFPMALVGVLPLSVWAVAARIQQYGWTEFRYARLLAIILFGILCIYSGYRLLRRESISLSAIPVVVGIGFMAVSMGPWSIVDVPRSSQLDRIEGIIGANSDILGAGGTIGIERVDDLERKDRQEIGDITDYLREHHGSESMAHLAGGDVEDIDRWARELARARFTVERPAEVTMDHERYGPIEQYEPSEEYEDDSSQDIEDDAPQDIGDDEPKRARFDADGPPYVTGAGTLRSFGYNADEPGGPWTVLLGYDDTSEMVVDGQEVTVSGDDHQTWRASIDELLDYARQSIRESTDDAEIPDAEIPDELRTVPLYNEYGGEVGSLIIGTIGVVDGQELWVERFQGYLLIYDR